MKASELIKLIESKCKEDDPIVEFYSYEWTDDLECCDYLERNFEKVQRKNGVIRIVISR